METNSHFLNLSWEVPLMLEIVSLGLLPHTPAQSLLMELGFASQFRVRNLVSWSCKCPSQSHKGSSNSKGIWSAQEIIKRSCF